MKKSMKKVLVAGTFDLLHPGHISLLKFASKFGDVYVIIARDENVKTLKGFYPVYDEKERKEIVSSLKYVKKAILGDKKDFLKPVKKIKPDVIILGYDQSVDKDKIKEELEKIGIKPKIIRYKPRNPKKWKSSKIIKRILKRFK